MRKLSLLLAFVLIFCGCSVPAEDPGSTGLASDFPQSTTTEPTLQSSVISSTVESTVATTYLSTEQTFENLKISAGSYRNTYLSDVYSEKMDYWLYVPQNACSDMPLVIFLHGKQEIGRIAEIENYGMIKKAREIYGDEYPFIAINPCLPSDSWTYGNYPALLKELIDYVSTEYLIDRSKIILTGHSLGSIGTWFMLSRYGDYFSAAVPVSCGCDETLDYENIAKVPIWPFVGDSDEYELRYKVGMERIINRLNDIGCQLELTVLEGRTHGQTVTDAYTPDVFAWMLSQ